MFAQAARSYGGAGVGSTQLEGLEGAGFAQTRSERREACGGSYLSLNNCDFLVECRSADRHLQMVVKTSTFIPSFSEWDEKIP